MSSCRCFDIMSVMETEEIRKFIQWLQDRVTVATGDAPTISFSEPTADDFSAKGFDAEAVAITLGSQWWSEMVTDIVETPEYAEPGESADQILSYAKDVVSEYVRKRLYT